MQTPEEGLRCVKCGTAAGLDEYSAQKTLGDWPWCTLCLVEFAVLRITKRRGRLQAARPARTSAAVQRRAERLDTIERILADSSERLGAGEVHERLGVAGFFAPRSTLHRDLASLVAEGRVHAWGKPTRYRYGLPGFEPQEAQMRDHVARVVGRLVNAKGGAIPRDRLLQGALMAARWLDNQVNKGAVGVTSHGLYLEEWRNPEWK